MKRVQVIPRILSARNKRTRRLLYQDIKEGEERQAVPVSSWMRKWVVCPAPPQRWFGSSGRSIRDIMAGVTLVSFAPSAVARAGSWLLGIFKTCSKSTGYLIRYLQLLRTSISLARCGLPLHHEATLKVKHTWHSKVSSRSFKALSIRIK